MHSQESFLKHKFSDINIWMDNSPNQFKTKELFSYFCDLPVIYDYVQWNFFIEYHGKSHCDTRFSQISNMLKLHVMNINNPPIQNTQELIQAITNQQKDQNICREKNEKDIIESTQLNLIISNIPIQKENLVISNFKFLHSFKVLPEHRIGGYLLTQKEKYCKEWEITTVFEKRKNGNCQVGNR